MSDELTRSEAEKLGRYMRAHFKREPSELMVGRHEAEPADSIGTHPEFKSPPELRHRLESVDRSGGKRSPDRDFRRVRPVTVFWPGPGLR